MKPSLHRTDGLYAADLQHPHTVALGGRALELPRLLSSWVSCSAFGRPRVRRSTVGVSSFGSPGMFWWREASGAVMPLGRPWPPSLFRHVLICTCHSNSGKSVDGESTEVSSSNPLLQNLPPRALEVAVVVLRLAT